MNEEKNLTENEIEQQDVIQENDVQQPLTDEQPTEAVSDADETAEDETTEQLTEDQADKTAQDADPEAAQAALEQAEAEPANEEPEVDPVAELMKKPPYYERYYLRYNKGERTTELDLEGTKSFLQQIGFDGGELLQARTGQDKSDLFQNTEKNKKNQMYCSYCGTEIAGVEYYRLPDGRLRCTSCSRSIVSDKEEIQQMCKRVIANMDNFFGATIDVPVSIEVLDERKLKKKVGVPLGTRDSQSMLILGVAINKKKKYSILLENGAPRISLVATFAHELTHIWQYTHWDNNKSLQKCPKGNRLLVYEGMAKWAEIQYLYLIGETAIAKREEYITRNRQDEYGIGFCLYEDHYPLSREAMVCEDTPFTPNSYPF